jgi:hypothetical protein
MDKGEDANTDAEEIQAIFKFSALEKHKSL